MGSFRHRGLVGAARGGAGVQAGGASPLLILTNRAEELVLEEKHIHRLYIGFV